METKIEVGDTVRIKENHPYSLIAKGTCGIVLHKAAGSQRGDWKVSGLYKDGDAFELCFCENELLLVRKHQEAQNG
jgi:hypothetical protein